MNPGIKTLDVREDLRSGWPVFDKIQATLSTVGQGEVLRLLVPFEPLPLLMVAAKKGFGHKSKQLPEGHWEVLFSRDVDTISQTNHPNSLAASACGCELQDFAEVIEVDARGLEPPQPMALILEALASLPRGAKLQARTDRRPVHLYMHLEGRGFVSGSEEQKDGSFITHIRHA